MAESHQENVELDDDRKIIVGNLPEHCLEEELLVNYFESRKQFGEGIVVEDVKFEDNEAVITFQKASDVDQVLQRHEIEPCKFVRSILTIQAFKSCSDNDAVDSGSFTVIQDDHRSFVDDGAGRYGTLQHCDSLSSLNSSISKSSFDSSELFGYGGTGHKIFSKEFKEVHLVYRQQGQDNTVLKLNETDVSPVVVSYAATTCSVTGSTQTKQADRQGPVHTNQEMSPTILQDVMRVQFGDEVKVITNIQTSNITIDIGKVQVTSGEDFQNAVVETMKTLENHVNVKLHRLDVERLDLALRHFEHILNKNQTIKIYTADDDFSFFIAYQTENEKVRIETHIAIVSKEEIIKHKMELPWTDVFKIEANRKQLDLQSAKTTCNKNCITIEGFKEDVLSTNVFINKILHTSHCVPKKLDEFVVNLLSEKDIIEDIEKLLGLTGTKVWWTISGRFLNVVTTQKDHASKAVEEIEKFFSKQRIELKDYLIDSDKWKITKSLALVNNKKRLCIDDTSDKPFVIIKGTTECCKNFVEITEDFKKQNLRERKSVSMTKAKCGFILKHHKEIFADKAEVEFYKIERGKCQTELIVEATQGGHDMIASKLKEITTLMFWICDEKDENLLKTISQSNDFRVPGTMDMFENKTEIIFKTGRIENEQVDVIVNSAPEHLNLGTGDHTITQSISIAAGAKAQTCLENVRRPVKVGDVIKGDAGTLACKAVFHAVLQHYDPDNKPLSLEILRNVVNTCLKKATTEGFASLAFPALCTGVHNYPVKTVAQIMFDAITKFLCQTEETSLMKIIIVFLDSDKKKKKAFEDCQRGHEQNLADMQGKHMIKPALSWPCRFYCQITAATKESATEMVKQVTAELNEQTVVKRLEQTQ